jgi:hypothetical protein
MQLLRCSYVLCPTAGDSMDNVVTFHLLRPLGSSGAAWARDGHSSSKPGSRKIFNSKTAARFIEVFLILVSEIRRHTDSLNYSEIQHDECLPMVTDLYISINLV